MHRLAWRTPSATSRRKCRCKSGERLMPSTSPRSVRRSGHTSPRDTGRAMSQQNVEIVRLAYAAFSERDLDALAELTDPDWVFDFSRSIGPDKGVYRGHEQVFRFAATNADAFERFQLSPTEYTVGSGGKIAVRHHVSARGRGSGVEWERIPDASLVWELRDAKVITTTLYQSHTEAVEAAGQGD